MEREGCKIVALVKSRKTPFFVIPAKAGIQSFQALIDSRLRGNDVSGTFYEFNKIKFVTNISILTIK